MTDHLGKIQRAKAALEEGLRLLNEGGEDTLVAANIGRALGMLDGFEISLPFDLKEEAKS